MKKMLHKIFSILLAACFILSAVPAPAAAAETPANTAVNGSYTDGKWSKGGNGSVTYTVDKHPMTLSKTAEVVGENTFKITLTVETESKTITQTVDGAVVLVIDLSNSMARCAECGADPNGFWWGETHENNCPYIKDGYSVKSSQSRLAAAKVAARNFLAAYAGDDASANRQLAIVTFSDNGNTVMGWKNVAGGSNDYSTALGTINDLRANGGTNMEGGLLNAYNLLDDVTCDSKSVVMLSDGAPTYGVTVQGSGSEGSSRLNTAVANQASAIKNAGAKLYTVCYGAENEKTYSNGPTVGKFLQDSVASSNCAYNANNTAALNSAFAAIVKEINEGLVGQGLPVTDPMADMIDMQTVITDGANFTNTDGSNTYIWTLDEHEDKTVGDSVHHVYTCSYTVELDVLDENFVEGTPFPTNERTYLTVDGVEYDFPVPGVTGVLPRTDVTVTKVWDDAQNQDGIRPESIEVQLKANGTPVGGPVTITGNEWTHTFEDLLVYENREEIEYTVVEIIPEESAESYALTSNELTKTEDGYKITITNTHEIEKTSVSGSKTWNDNNNQDGKRPESITINLLADRVEVDSVVVTPDADGNWTYEFSGLPKYRAGKVGEEIVYTITEDAVEDYTTNVDSYNVTNTHELDTIDISVEKIWDDAENQDKTRPDSVTIHLLANGVETGESLTLNEGNQWTGTFNDLIKNREGKVGEPVVYTVTEELPEENAKFYNLTDTETVTNEDGSTSIILTNTHELDTIDISVKKEWVDANNQDGLRKDVTIHLLADGVKTGKSLTLNEGNQWTGTFTGLTKNKAGKVGESIVYTITEDNVAGYEKTDITGSVADGFIVTNTHTPEKTSVKVTKVWDDAENQDGKRPTEITVQLLANGEPTNVTAKVTGTGDKWTYEFKDLDKYADGQEIAYTVAEQLDKDSVYKQTGFTGDAATGFTITNSYTPELIDISGEKTWVDSDNAYNTRPDSITITLKGGDVEKTVTVTADDDWKWSFTGLPKYAKGQVGQEIDYTIVEKAVTDYTTEYNGNNVINTLAPGETSVTVTKKWEDNNDQDGIRPNEVKILLLADGEETGDTLILTKNNWTDAFTNLPMYKDGKEIVYDVREVPVEVEGYTFKAKSGDMKEGFVITNGYTVKTVNIEGTKTWDDNNDKNLSRPDSIVVRLLANGTEVDKKTVTADDNWSYEFTGKPMNENGMPIAYTVSEDPVDDYSATYNGYNITNTYSPRTINIQVTKAWNDANDQDGKRPEKITVKLQADILDVEETLTLTAEDNWTGSFTNLVKYSDGKEVKYSIVEEKVEGYETVSITGDQSKGFTITNTHEPEVIKQIAGKKTWNDANNQDGKRPESITVKLLANGIEVDTQVVSEKESWIYSFENLPKFEAGEEIIYTVVENEVPGYSATYSKDNYNITNSYTPETINIKVSKSWVDSNDADGIRPTKVTIYLYANGEKTGDKLVLTKDEKWTGSFTDLPKYEDGKDIKYTIAEKDVKGYNAVIKGSAGNGFTVTNSHNSIPKTGDERTPILWIAMMLLAIIVVFFASRPFFYKKGKYSR